MRDVRASETEEVKEDGSGAQVGPACPRERAGALE